MAASTREPIVCAGCGAVYQNRHWHAQGAPILKAHHQPGAPIPIRICPKCHHANNHRLPHGFLHADGSFVHAHRHAIENLLRHEAGEIDATHPTDEVLNWGDDGSGGVLVTTTSEQLAIRLGRALERAYDGQLLFGFSHENRLAHVWWHRDTEPHRRMS